MDQGRQGRDQVDTAVVQNSRATPCGSSFMRSPTILAIVTRLSNRQEECAQRPVEIARSAARPSFGLPELLVAIHTSRRSCSKAGKARIFALVWKSSGESRFQSLSRARPLDILTLRSIFGNLKTSLELGSETFGVRALTPSLLGRGRA